MSSTRAVALGPVVRREVDERVVVALEVAQVPEHGADGRVVFVIEHSHEQHRRPRRLAAACIVNTTNLG